MAETTAPGLDILLAGSGTPLADPLSEALRRRGHTVHAAQVAPETMMTQAQAQAHPLSDASLTELTELTERAARADAVIVVGGLGPVAATVADAETLEILMRRMRSGSTLVYTSTLAVFGHRPDDVVDEFTDPTTPEAFASQRVAELRVLATDDYLRPVVVRAGLVITDDGGPVLEAAAREASGSGVSRYAGGADDHYPTVHADEVVELYCRLVEQPTAQGVFHAASGSATASELAALVARMAGVDRVEPWADPNDEPPSISVRAAPSRAVDELGWHPASTVTGRPLR